MRSMSRPFGIPMLHIHGDADPYVLDDPVERTQRYSPHGRYVSIAGAGHYSHEEAPEEVNGHLIAISRAGVPVAAQLTHAPVATGAVSPICAS